MKFGIMQGRLSMPQGEALQFFPSDWQMEFVRARDLGFDAIEWIYDDPIDNNPIRSDVGRLEIDTLSKQNGVSVQSICADVFMKHHLTVRDSPSVKILSELLQFAELMDVQLVGVPLLEDNLPVTDQQFEAVVNNLQKVLSDNPGKTEFALEVDLPAESIIKLIDAIGSNRVGVCYDTGNAMTHYFDAGLDIRHLGKYLKQVHIKDRVAGTKKSVYLGDGSVNFPDVCEALLEVKFDGLCILQAWRGEDYIADAKRQLEFFRNQFVHNR